MWRIAICTLLLGACAHGRTAGSYLPIGATAQYGNRTNDGVTWTLSMTAERAVDTLSASLRTAGYVIASRTDRVLRTAPQVVAGDTTMVVVVQVLPIEVSEPASSVVLTATYSVRSRQLRDAPVIQRPNTISPLYTRLSALADTLHRPRTR